MRRLVSVFGGFRESMGPMADCGESCWPRFVVWRLCTKRNGRYAQYLMQRPRCPFYRSRGGRKDGGYRCLTMRYFGTVE